MLLKRIAANEDAAMREFLHRYSSLIWMIVRSYGTFIGDQEDMVQDILIRIWMAADKYDPTRAKEVTFISMIARRACIDACRRLRRGVPMVGAVLLDSLVCARYPVNDNQEDLDRLRDELRQLNPAQAEVVRLSAEHTGMQVAQSLNMPIGTVKTHQCRGSRLLRMRMRRVG